MPIPNCPLSDEHCNLANQALQECTRCREELARLESLGIPVDQARAENEANAAFFTKLKQAYFPDHA